MKSLKSWTNNMAFNSQYYTTKQQKLQQKLAQKKDQFLVDVLNLAQRMSSEIQEIQAEHQEISKIIEENEPKETKPKKKGGK